MHNMTDPIGEIDAMKKIAEAFSRLDKDAIRRVLSWASDLYAGEPKHAPKDTVLESHKTATPEMGALNAYESLADLFAKANPKSDSDKALVAAYWFQVKQGEGELDALKLNSELKHLGHRVGNITAAFRTLMSKEPQLIIQTKKYGTTKQARKRYKLTNEGQSYIKKMLEG